MTWTSFVVAGGTARSATAIAIAVAVGGYLIGSISFARIMAHRLVPGAELTGTTLTWSDDDRGFVTEQISATTVGQAAGRPHRDDLHRGHLGPDHGQEPFGLGTCGGSGALIGQRQPGQRPLAAITRRARVGRDQIDGSVG